MVEEKEEIAEVVKRDDEDVISGNNNGQLDTVKELKEITCLENNQN